MVRMGRGCGVDDLFDCEPMHERRHLLARDIVLRAVLVVGRGVAALGYAVVLHPLDVGNEHAVVIHIGETRRCERDDRHDE